MRLKVLAAGTLLLALTPSSWLAWKYRDMPHLGYFHDDSIYWVSARSLAEGAGYRIPSLPEQPFQTKYPPLFPLALSLVWRAAPDFPANLPWATLLVWLSVPIMGGLLWRLFRGMQFGSAASLGLAAAVVVNPYVTLSGVSLMSELPFCCLLFAALILAERAGDSDRTMWTAAAAGLLAGCAYLTRNAALPLLITAPACLVLRRQPKRAALFACAMLPAAIGWNVWAHARAVPASDPVLVYYTSYLGYHLMNVSWADLPLLVWKNFDGLLSSVGGLLVFDLADSPWGKHLSRVLAVACMAGAARLCLARRRIQYGAYSLAAAGLLVSWHYPPNERLMLPLYPVLLAGFWAELSRLGASVRSAWKHGAVAERATALALSAGIAGLASMAAVTAGQTNFRTLPGILEQNRRLIHDNRKAYRWMAEHVPEGASVLAYRDAVLHLYTGRRAFRLPPAPMGFYHEDREAILRPFRTLAELAGHRPCDLVFLTAADFHGDLADPERREARRLIAATPGLEDGYRTPLSAVYRITSGSGK